MPITLKEYERLLDAPALCEQLRIRDLLDNVAIQLDGSFVAAYELGGLAALYASDEERNRNKQAIEALIRSLPERSLRMQIRFEITEGVGDLLDRHNREGRNPSPILHAIDQRACPGMAKARGRRRLCASPFACLLHLEPPDSPSIP